METPLIMPNILEYRTVFIRPTSRAVLTLGEAGRHRLPRVGIAQGVRPVKSLVKAVEANWGMNALILDIWDAEEGRSPCAIGRLLSPEFAPRLSETSTARIAHAELSALERQRLEALFEGRTGSPLSRMEWIDEATAWVETATGRGFSSKKQVDQWNAGGGFQLLRFGSDDGQQYWLKATAAPNAHEFSVTCCLSELIRESVPRLVAARKDWNAWLTEHAGSALPATPSIDSLARAAVSIAGFQLRTIGQTGRLLAAGIADQRLPALEVSIDAVITYLIGAMGRQRSTKVAPLSRDRLFDLGDFLHVACARLRDLQIPDTLIHNDLNPGNILDNGARIVFTDWSDAAVGPPFLSCERLARLGGNGAENIRAAYGACWSNRLPRKCVEEAMRLMPVLSIYAYLYGRGDWLMRTDSLSSRFEGYARSLARHLDRAARDYCLLEG